MTSRAHTEAGLHNLSHVSDKEVAMLCAELEKLEGQLDDIITELEQPGLSEWQREELEALYKRLSRQIRDHRTLGHDGAPCYEE